MTITRFEHQVSEEHVCEKQIAAENQEIKEDEDNEDSSEEAENTTIERYNRWRMLSRIVLES